MKTATLITAVILGLTVSCAFAQPQPGEKKWDISKVDTSKFPPASTQQGVTFDKDILPLFKTSCVRCHSGAKPRAGYQLDTLEGVLKGGRDGVMVTAGESQNSLLVAAVSRVNPRLAMPPQPRNRPGGGPPPGAGGSGGAPGGTNGPARHAMPPPPPPLTADQVGLVRAWIDQGAK
jgi:hypothetical protein